MVVFDILPRKFVQYDGKGASRCAVAELCGVALSPLKRALKTAEIICSGEIVCDNRIIERCNGELEGRTNVNSLIDFSDPNDTRYGVEPLPEFRERITDFWNDILRSYSGKNILVVTHAGVVIYSQAYFRGEPENGDYRSYKIKNCDIIQIENNS